LLGLLGDKKKCKGKDCFRESVFSFSEQSVSTITLPSPHLLIGVHSTKRVICYSYRSSVQGTLAFTIIHHVFSKMSGVRQSVQGKVVVRFIDLADTIRNSRTRKDKKRPQVHFPSFSIRKPPSHTPCTAKGKTPLKNAPPAEFASAVPLLTNAVAWRVGWRDLARIPTTRQIPGSERQIRTESIYIGYTKASSAANIRVSLTWIFSWGDKFIPESRTTGTKETDFVSRTFCLQSLLTPFLLMVTFYHTPCPVSPR
jgi:hypothetical protein